MSKFLNYNKAIFGKSEKQAVMKALNKGWLSNGMDTLNFEKEFADWWGIKYSLTTNSGSTANLVALQALDLPKGSEVITPAGGAFPTTISPLYYLGLKPVFVDIKCLTIDPEEIVKAISKKTKVILFSHTLGQIPNMKRIVEIAKKYDLRIMEDCCDAVGSKQDGKMVGTFGDIATISFYPAHHMTTGEGGMVITNNRKLYKTANSIRDWGRDCVCRADNNNPMCVDRYRNPPFDHRYYYSRIGLNFKMSEMQAAFGREQLKRLDKFIEIRRRNYKILADIFNEPFDEQISPFAYPLLSKNKNKMMHELQKRNIESRVIFAGNIIKHPAFKDLDYRVVGDLKNSNILFKQGYFVGVGPNLTINDMKFIGKSILEIEKTL